LLLFKVFYFFKGFNTISRFGGIDGQPQMQIVAGTKYDALVKLIAPTNMLLHSRFQMYRLPLLAPSYMDEVRYNITFRNQTFVGQLNYIVTKPSKIKLQ
jgi:hypothetical protein